jgi:hypothetical protein
MVFGTPLPNNKSKMHMKMVMHQHPKDHGKVLAYVYLLDEGHRWAGNPR